MLITAYTSLRAALAVAGGLFFADFVSGLFHWFEDRFGDPKWPVLGATIRANQEHHFKPRAFLEGSFLARNKEVFALGALFLAAFTALGWLNLFTGTAVAFGMFANEFHRAAHRVPQENGRLFTVLQKTGLMQSFMHHAHHHRQGKDSHYCVMTNYVNPVLERIAFFPALEKVVLVTTGAAPRLDESVNPRYRMAA